MEELVLGIDPGVRNLAICGLTASSDVPAIWRCIDFKHQNALVQLQNLKDELDSTDWFSKYSVKHVFIEAQMTRKMSNVAAAIMMYFTVHGVDISSKSPICKRKYIGPETEYKGRKDAAVLYVENRVGQKIAAKKKDDMADAYLYALDARDKFLKITAQ